MTAARTLLRHKGESYRVAEIMVEQVAPDQPPPRKEFD